MEPKEQWNTLLEIFGLGASPLIVEREYMLGGPNATFVFDGPKSPLFHAGVADATSHKTWYVDFFPDGTWRVRQSELVQGGRRP